MEADDEIIRSSPGGVIEQDNQRASLNIKTGASLNLDSNSPTGRLKEKPSVIGGTGSVGRPETELNVKKSPYGKAFIESIVGHFRFDIGPLASMTDTGTSGRIRELAHVIAQIITYIDFFGYVFTSADARSSVIATVMEAAFPIIFGDAAAKHRIHAHSRIVVPPIVTGKNDVKERVSGFIQEILNAKVFNGGNVHGSFESKIINTASGAAFEKANAGNSAKSFIIDTLTGLINTSSGLPSKVIGSIFSSQDTEAITGRPLRNNAIADVMSMISGWFGDYSGKIKMGVKSNAGTLPTVITRTNNQRFLIGQLNKTAQSDIIQAKGESELHFKERNDGLTLNRTIIQPIITALKPKETVNSEIRDAVNATEDHQIGTATNAESSAYESSPTLIVGNASVGIVPNAETDDSYIWVYQISEDTIYIRGAYAAVQNGSILSLT